MSILSMEKPAVLISEDMLSFLEDRALQQASFFELTKTEYPWEIDLKKFHSMRKDLKQLELRVRTEFPERQITCIISGKGVHWVAEDVLNDFCRKIERPLETLKSYGPQPIWKFTTLEIIASHISNMRQLCLAVGHDMILLHNLKEALGDNHDFIKREFQNCERYVKTLLEKMKECSEIIPTSASENVVMLERCRVTQEMLNRDFLDEDILGYSKEQLLNVQKILEERCQEEFTDIRMKLPVMFNYTTDSLREGESTQLTRLSRWEMTYSMMDSIPEEYRGQAQFNAIERKGLNSIVASRELELGASDTGKTALAESEKAEKPTQKEPAEPESVEITSEESPAAPKPVKRHRMAVLDRRKR